MFRIQPPSTVIGAFTVVLVPELSEHFYKNDFNGVKKDVEKSVKFTMLVSALFVPAFFCCGNEIGEILFGNSYCGKFLSASAFLTTFMGLSGITTSILNSVGKENKTLVYYVIGAGLMLLCVYVLPNYLGVYSLTVGYAAVYALTAFLNVRLITKTCKVSPKYLKFAFYSAAFNVPCCVFGLLLKNALIKIMPVFAVSVITGVSVTAVSVMLYFTFGLVNATAFATLKKPRKSAA